MSKTFYVKMKVVGEVVLEVTAGSASAAFDRAIAHCERDGVSLDGMDVLEVVPVNCEDEDGNLTDSNY